MKKKCKIVYRPKHVNTYRFWNEVTLMESTKEETCDFVYVGLKRNSWIFFISSLIVSDKVRGCFQFSMRNKSNNEQTEKIRPTETGRKKILEKMPITEKSCGWIVQINQPLTIPAFYNAWNKNHCVTDYKKGSDSIDGVRFFFLFFSRLPDICIDWIQFYTVTKAIWCNRTTTPKNPDFFRNK